MTITAVSGSDAEPIRVAIHPTLLIEDPRGKRSRLLASVFDPEGQAWSYEIDQDGGLVRVSGLIGYRVLGVASAPEGQFVAATPASSPHGGDRPAPSAKRDRLRATA